jgi:tetratricopeptide (TPR) repeat protein
MALAPDDPQAMVGLIRLYARERRFAEALKLAERVQKSQPKSALGPHLAGNLLYQSKRYAEAAKAYDAAFVREPSGELLVKRHLARTSAGEKPSDVPLHQWLAQSPNDVAVRLLLAEQHTRSGRYREAAEHYRFVVEADPNHAVALNNLASAYLKLNDAQALHFAEAAHRLKPDEALILDTLGIAQMRYGKPEQAVATLKKAVARDPKMTEIRVNYALALARAGDKSAARAEVQRLIDSGQSVALDAASKEALGLR